MIVKIALGILLIWSFAGAADAQIHRCTGADGRVSYSDTPCPGSVPVTPKPAPNAPSSPSKSSATNAPLANAHQAAQNEVRLVIDGYQQTPKSPLQRSKKQECDAGNATACKEWEALERAELKAFSDKLAPAAKNLGRAAVNACTGGDQSACKSACPEAHSHGDRFDSQLLSACSKVLGRESGGFWQVLSNDAMSHNPVERKYAMRMPKGTVLQEDLWIACYRKRVNAVNVELSSWSVKHTVNVDNDTGVKSGHKYSTIGQYGGPHRNESSASFGSLQEWANRNCAQ